MAFKIKTTSPERYRVRPSLGLISAFATNKIEVFYQPIVPDTDDFSDVLKDKFLINLYKNSSETSYKTDSKEKKPSFQHRLKASVKKSLLKTPSLEKNTDNPTVATSIDKDKDVYLKEVCFKQFSSKEVFCQEVTFFVMSIRKNYRSKFECRPIRKQYFEIWFNFCVMTLRKRVTSYSAKYFLKAKINLEFYTGLIINSQLTCRTLIVKDSFNS